MDIGLYSCWNIFCVKRVNCTICKKYNAVFGGVSLAHSRSESVGCKVEGERERSDLWDLLEEDCLSEVVSDKICAPGEYKFAEGLRSPCCISLPRNLLPSLVSKFDSSTGHGSGVVQ
jgi:hypothetical protein